MRIRGKEITGIQRGVQKNSGGGNKKRVQENSASKKRVPCTRGKENRNKQVKRNGINSMAEQIKKMER